jgi:hypothetical protein
LDIAGQRGVYVPAAQEITDCLARWRALLARLGDDALRVNRDDRKQALHEIEVLAYHGPDVDDDAAFDTFDVLKFYGMGCDAVWPSLKVGRLVDAGLAKAKETYLRVYPKYLRAGAYLDVWSNEVIMPLTMADLEALSIPWLPDSFWWRHVPELLAPA